jgi:hypothetical protein
MTSRSNLIHTIAKRALVTSSSQGLGVRANKEGGSGGGTRKQVPQAPQWDVEQEPHHHYLTKVEQDRVEYTEWELHHQCLTSNGVGIVRSIEKLLIACSSMSYDSYYDAL